MKNKEQKKIDDFMASCREDDGGEEYEQKPKVELNRDTIHTLSVEAVITGENQFGDYIGLATDESMVFFGGYEAADLKRVIGDNEAPFTVEVMRTQIESSKNEGRTFNKVFAKIL